MTYKWIRKEQRKINKFIRELNKKIEEDSLLNGQYYIHQRKLADIHTFEDNSGGIMFIEFELISKSTRNIQVVCVDNYSYTNALPIMLNNFIVNERHSLKI